MPHEPTTVSELIELFDSAEQFARAINLKHTSHGRTMRQRGSIPPRWWDAIVVAASKRGIEGVNHRVLEQIHANVAPKRSPSSEKVGASA